MEKNRLCNDGCLVAEARGAQYACQKECSYNGPKTTLESIGSDEWSDDYKCRKCGAEFTVAADSDFALKPEMAHDCKGA